MDHEWSSRRARAFPFHPSGRDPPSKLHRELNKLMKLASRMDCVRVADTKEATI